MFSIGGFTDGVTSEMWRRHGEKCFNFLALVSYKNPKEGRRFCFQGGQWGMSILL